jgi:hypothetical protein
MKIKKIGNERITWYLRRVHTYHLGERGSAVVKTLCFEPENRGFENRWGEWIFSIRLILPASLDPLPEAYKQCFWRVKRGRCIGLTSEMFSKRHLVWMWRVSSWRENNIPWIFRYVKIRLGWKCLPLRTNGFCENGNESCGPIRLNNFLSSSTPY